jgi:hypothetical protein
MEFDLNTVPYVMAFDYRYSYPPAMRRRAASVQARPAASATAVTAARYQQQQQQLLQLQQDLRKTENIMYLQLRFTYRKYLFFYFV